MSNYIAKGSYVIDIQEGTPRTITFVVPDAIVMTSRKAKLQIRKNTNTAPIVTIDTDGGAIVKNLQRLICSFSAADSIGHGGKYEWDLIVYTDTTDGIKIGKGATNIIPRITRL